MPLTTPPTAPTHHTEPAQALAQVQRLYQQQIDHLRAAMQRFVAGDLLHEPVRAFYPFVRVHTTTVARADSTLAYGFVEGPPGRYETTLTRPDLFANYYLEQFRLLRKNHGVELEVGVSTHPIPIHFSFAEHDHIEGTLSPERRMLMRDLFDLPDLAAMDDGIANGTWQAKPGEAQPLSLFTAPRVDYSLHRLRQQHHRRLHHLRRKSNPHRRYRAPRSSQSARHALHRHRWPLPTPTLPPMPLW